MADDKPISGLPTVPSIADTDAFTSMRPGDPVNTKNKQNSGSQVKQYANVAAVSTLQNVVAAAGITLTAGQDMLIPIQSSTAGDTDITAIPQIAAGSVGQRLTLVGNDDTKTVTLDDGDGVSLNNGVSFTFGEDSLMELVFVNSVWNERCRKA